MADDPLAASELGKTVLLTTHYLDEAQELADRVAIIKGGQILAEGSPAELGVGAGSRYRVAYVERERRAGDPSRPTTRRACSTS